MTAGEGATYSTTGTGATSAYVTASAGATYSTTGVGYTYSTTTGGATKTGAVTNMGGADSAGRGAPISTTSTISACATWWTGAVPEISKVFVPRTIWMAIGAVAVGKTVDATVLGNLLLYKNGHANNLVQDLQLWNLREHLHSQDHGHLSSHNNNNKHVNNPIQEQQLCNLHGLLGTGMRLRNLWNLHGSLHNQTMGTCRCTTNKRACQQPCPRSATGISESICTVKIMATCRRTTNKRACQQPCPRSATVESPRASAQSGSWPPVVAQQQQHASQQICPRSAPVGSPRASAQFASSSRSWNAVDVTVIVVTGAAQITVRAGVTNSTTGADCTCSATTGRDSKTGAVTNIGLCGF